MSVLRSTNLAGQKKAAFDLLPLHFQVYAHDRLQRPIPAIMGEVRLEMVPMAGAGAGASADASADADVDASSEAGGRAPSNAFTGWLRSAATGARAHVTAGAGVAGAAQRRGGSSGSGAGDGDGDGDEDDRVVVIDNLHKTYLLGVEGLAALVCVYTPALACMYTSAKTTRSRRFGV